MTDQNKRKWAGPRRQDSNNLRSQNFQELPGWNSLWSSTDVQSGGESILFWSPTTAHSELGWLLHPNRSRVIYHWTFGIILLMLSPGHKFLDCGEKVFGKIIAYLLLIIYWINMIQILLLNFKMRVTSRNNFFQYWTCLP